MTGRLHETLSRAVRRMLRPLIRILLRNGVPYNDLAEQAKRVYVDVAMAEFQVPGRKPSVSRTATITGLTRKEVRRLVEALESGEEAVMEPHNRAARVVAGWVRDPDFQDGRQEPRPLSMDDEGGGFPALVRRYSGDMTARAVLDELERVGAVARVADGRVVLTSRSYIPSRDDAAKIEIMGTDTAYLLETIDHNLAHVGEAARFQRKVLYDNLPEEFLEAFREQATGDCQQLLESLDSRLAAGDRDTNPEAGGSGRRLAGIGIYYFERDLGEPGSEDEGK